jgi:hypothetical protein
MPDDSKKEINWTIVLIALGLIGFYFFPQGKDLTPDDLSSKTVTLSSDVTMIHNSKRDGSTYRQLWTKEAQAAFTIGSPGDVVAPEGSLDSLKKGDTLNVKYASVHDNDLNDGADEVPIYFLQKGKRVYFELSSYNKVQDAAAARIRVIAMVLGILLGLYGFKVISQKYAWIAGGAGVIVFVILRSINLF